MIWLFVAEGLDKQQNLNIIHAFLKLLRILQ